MKAWVNKYCRLARLDKPWGAILLAWPTFIALTLVKAPIWLWGVFILGVILTRSAGCVINDYADQWLDGHVERTCFRPLVSGEVTAHQALVFFAILMLLASALLLFLPVKAKLLALLSALMIVVYPYTKRWFPLPQLFLGLTFSMGVPMAYFSHQQPMTLQGWGLFLLSAVWVVLYDTIYALADIKDDQKLRVHSMALSLGKYAKGFIVYGYALLWVLWGVWATSLPAFGYFTLPWLFLGINLWQQCTQIKDGQFFQAFLANQRAGGWLWLGVMLSVVMA